MALPSQVTLYHNPACGTSRNVLALIRGHGIEPNIVEYLKTPPTHEELKGLLKKLHISVRDLLRQKGTPYEEFGLGNLRWSDDELIDFVVKHPILMNRPVVVTEKGARLCRPAETVLELLEEGA